MLPFLHLALLAAPDQWSKHSPQPVSGLYFRPLISSNALFIIMNGDRTGGGLEVAF